MVLIIDDDMAIRSSLSLLLEKEGFAVSLAEKEGPALRALHAHPVSLIIMDMNFSNMTTGDEGLALLKEVKDRWPEVPVILITAWGSINLAVEGMKLGAMDFISKPWNNNRLLSWVKTALSLASERQGKEKDRSQLDGSFNFENIIGADPGLLAVLNTVGRIAATDAPVLIQGESGTGKELLAEAVHNNSHRKDGPFVKVNLGAISQSLFESEMFGHKKGAFTDAVRDREGRFMSADKGTIFLDEIGELDLASQVKLLRVLQEKRFEPVGDSRTVEADFRVVCATNKDLAQLVAEGTFREDLFYRINLITLVAPPLRDRKDDLALLTEFFLKQAANTFDRGPLELAPGALAFLRKQGFPGNVRELKNLVERTALLGQTQTLGASDFKNSLQPVKNKINPSLPEPGTATLEDVERSMIVQALEAFPNNYTRVADSLGLNRGQLYTRMQKYGLGPYAN